MAKTQTPIDEPMDILWDKFMQYGTGGETGLTKDEIEDLLFAQSAKIKRLEAVRAVRGGLAVSEGHE